MKSVFFAAAILFVLTETAQATIFCEILKTPDGFVALRSGPSATAKLLLKLNTGEQVQVGLRKSGTWEEVIYYQVKKKASDSNSLTGWVKTRFLANDCG